MSITDFCLLRVLLRTRNKSSNNNVSNNIHKMNLLPKVTQRYVFFLKITTLPSTPHSQSSNGNSPFLTVFRNPKSKWNIKMA